MKVKLITVMLVLFLLGIALHYTQMLVPQSFKTSEQTQEQQKSFAPFPDIAFTKPNGEKIQIDQLKEQVVLVHFWAAWCAICYTEFPDLLKYVDNSHGKVALVSVSLDDNYADSEKALNKIAAKNHLSMHGSNLYWAWDKDKSLSLKIFNTVKVPETIVVNDKRQMVDKIIGLGPWNEALAPQ